jgi:hypothetical protein
VRFHCLEVIGEVSLLVGGFCRSSGARGETRRRRKGRRGVSDWVLELDECAMPMFCLGRDRRLRRSNGDAVRVNPVANAGAIHHVLEEGDGALLR